MSNIDGKFVLLVLREFENDMLVILLIGYKSFKIFVSEFDNIEEIFLEEDIVVLDEVFIVVDFRFIDGNGIMVRVMEWLECNMLD